MNLEKLQTAITESGLSSVRIKEYMAEDPDFTFDGTLEEFLSVAKELNIKPVFLAVRKLEAEEFSHTPDAEIWNEFAEDEEDNEVGEPEKVFLPELVPELRGYTQYIGEAGSYRICLSSGNWTLNYFLDESWWDEVLDKLEAARVQVDSNLEKVFEEKRRQETEKREAREREILTRLDSLLDNADFVQLTTHRAMQAFAAENISGLEELRSNLLKNKIAELSDKIKIRGLGRKK